MYPAEGYVSQEEMTMKKIIALLSLVLVIAMFAGCAGGTNDATADEAKGDLATIEAAGQLIIGITEYDPMNYYDENGTLIGFDTEYAQAVCEELGVEAKFQVINWETKEAELAAGNIDVIWNGLTVTEDRKKDMDFSEPYLTNKQCVVINKANAADYTDAASLSSAILTAESGSAGETAILADASLSKGTFTPSDSQKNALVALAAGNADAAVIDITLAQASVGEGTYSDLVILEGIDLADEQYAIGFRVGSDLTAKVDEITNALIEDGTLAEIAEKYELTERYNEALTARK